jgi:hypothetical protein
MLGSGILATGFQLHYKGLAQNLVDNIYQRAGAPVSLRINDTSI